MVFPPFILKLMMVAISAGVLIVCFCVFFDQAVLTRSGTIYRVKTKKKKVALTFDDGPSAEWTPRILAVLKEAGITATFFMIGHHVKKYPDIARRVAEEGHTIGNHGFAHTVILYYKPAEIEAEIKYTETVIERATGLRTRLYRPPKAWMKRGIKKIIRDLGYEIVLWSLNSKDWVTFDHRLMVKYLVRQVKSGDILLFHDSGNVFSAEGGDRRQTVAAIPLLAKKLQAKGFEFVSVEELINSREAEGV